MKARHCFEFTPEYVFEVDNGLNLACYCPDCESMVTIDWASNKETWEAIILEQEQKVDINNNFWIDF